MSFATGPIGTIIFGDLVYKLRKRPSRADFSSVQEKVIMRYKRIGYNIYVMQESTSLVIYPIASDRFAFLFNCTPVGRAPDIVMVPA